MSCHLAKTLTVLGFRGGRSDADAAADCTCAESQGSDWPSMATAGQVTVKSYSQPRSLVKDKGLGVVA